MELTRSVKNTPGTRGGVAQAAVTERWPWKEEKTPENIFFLVKKKYIYFFCIYFLVMPKYWGNQIFSLRSFPDVGQKHTTEKKEKRETESW